MTRLITITMLCSGIQCESLLPVDQDWLQLDMPGEASRLFCNTSCLLTWVNWTRNREHDLAIQEEESHDD